MPESMASEPAPRQDELDREWLAGMIAAFLSGARGVGVLHMKPWPNVAERLVAWLDERGLLADPAQTTELEGVVDVPVGSEAYRLINQLTADLEQARAQRDEAMQTAGQLRDDVREHQVAAASLYGRVFVALGLSITEPWAGLAEAAAKVRAERDERQARIDSVPNILRQHYLAWIECDHDKQMDNPQCACSKVDLGWHPTVGDAVNAWIEHVRAELHRDVGVRDAASEDTP